MKLTGILAAAAMLAASTAACSGGAETIDTPKALADKIGCTSTYAADSTDEIGVEAVGKCTVDGDEIRLLTFANDEARDTFVKVAKGFGSRYVTGSGFAVEVDSASTEATVKNKL